ncbi:hypothetical protein HYPBUDRAFT_3771 [Hyphopichia burtonii NRRL Y-1933]|uniref:Proteasome assembly chaperone 3 n=1 Tax=Hyphopichia burtonii NRRL Y-1933 TaxID=984485 RepID=A0A1E4RRF4_9ASCO|nr:hypothetical protein HYPBUDRAFT_3771 [Hyphopichia burtonii NRRL Y-1933]ODV69842.1 hypothetical protein HYPBUDRAFT_3771 [Hyphopichia burtonii NRRL Y-1933]
MDAALPQFSKVLVKKYPQESDVEFTFHKIELSDKIILNVHTNGIIDTTFDIPISSKAAISSTTNSIDSSEEGLGVEPIILVGDSSNLKIQIIASQIGKLILLLANPKNLILSIGSRWFGKGDEVKDDDFEKLMFVLANIKEIL